MSRMISIESLQDPEAVSRMCHESMDPVYVMNKDDQLELVLMSMEAYDENVRQLKIKKELEKAEEMFRQGKKAEARAALTEIKKKYDPIPKFLLNHLEIEE